MARAECSPLWMSTRQFEKQLRWFLALFHLFSPLPSLKPRPTLQCQENPVLRLLCFDSERGPFGLKKRFAWGKEALTAISVSFICPQALGPLPPCFSTPPRSFAIQFSPPLLWILGVRFEYGHRRIGKEVFPLCPADPFSSAGRAFLQLERS